VIPRYYLIDPLLYWIISFRCYTWLDSFLPGWSRKIGSTSSNPQGIEKSRHQHLLNEVQAKRDLYSHHRRRQPNLSIHSPCTPVDKGARIHPQLSYYAHFLSVRWVSGKCGFPLVSLPRPSKFQCLFQIKEEPFVYLLMGRDRDKEELFSLSFVIHFSFLSHLLGRPLDMDWEFYLPDRCVHLISTHPFALLTEDLINSFASLPLSHIVPTPLSLSPPPRW